MLVGRVDRVVRGPRSGRPERRWRRSSRRRARRIAGTTAFSPKTTPSMLTPIARRYSSRSKMLGQPAAGRDAGVEEGQVEPAELARPRRRPRPRSPRGRLTSASHELGPELVGGAVPGVGLDVGEDHLRALLDQPRGGRPPQSVGSPGHQCHLAFEVHGGSLPEQRRPRRPAVAPRGRRMRSSMGADNRTRRGTALNPNLANLLASPPRSTPTAIAIRLDDIAVPYGAMEQVQPARRRPAGEQGRRPGRPGRGDAAERPPLPDGLLRRAPARRDRRADERAADRARDQALHERLRAPS